MWEVHLDLLLWGIGEAYTDSTGRMHMSIVQERKRSTCDERCRRRYDAYLHEMCLSANGMKCQLDVTNLGSEAEAVQII